MVDCTNINFILDKMQDDDLPHYTVKRANSSDKIDEYKADEPNVNIARQRLQKLVETLSGNIEIILSRPKKGAGGDTTQVYKYGYRCNNNNNNSFPLAGFEPVKSLNNVDIASEIDKALNKEKMLWEKELEIRELKRELKEAKSESGLEKYMPMIMGLFAPSNQIPVTGANDESIEGNDIVLRRALGVLNNNIENLHLVLQKLAILSIEQPELVKTILTTLNSMVSDDKKLEAQ